MEVSGTGPVQGPLPVNQTRPTTTSAQPSAAKPIATRDEVEISSAGKMLEQMHESSQMRSERLAQIKSAIEAGEYETPEKLEAALERFLDEVELDERS